MIFLPWRQGRAPSRFPLPQTQELRTGTSACKTSQSRSGSTRLAPVTMVHKRNPYADIPSLYDMYVQAAPRDREPERFGMEIFRNGTRQSDAIPMDMPVGPDYVVGPGDGLGYQSLGRRLAKAGSIG